MKLVNVIRVLCIRLCFYFFYLENSVKRNGVRGRKRHLYHIDAFQCVAEYVRHCRLHWISALRNKHHVATSEMHRCVRVCCSRMFCANCVSAIIFNINEHTQYSTETECTHTQPQTNEHTTEHSVTNIEICSFFKVFAVMFICVYNANQYLWKKVSAFGIEIGQTHKRTQWHTETHAYTCIKARDDTKRHSPTLK